MSNECKVEDCFVVPGADELRAQFSRLQSENRELAEALRKLHHVCAKGAGFTPELLADDEAFAAFVKEADAYTAAAISEAEAALARHTTTQG